MSVYVFYGVLPDTVFSGVTSSLQMKVSRFDLSNNGHLVDLRETLKSAKSCILQTHGAILKVLNKRLGLDIQPVEVPVIPIVSEGDEVVIFRTVGLNLPFGDTKSQFSDQEVKDAIMFATLLEVHKPVLLPTILAEFDTVAD